MAEKPDQLFETMLKEAGVPTTEAAMKAEWDAINAAEGSQITNNSAWSPFWRLISAIVTAPALWLVRLLIRDALPNVFLKFASGSYLDVYAWGVELERKPAAHAEGVVLFTRASASGSLTIPRGTAVESPAINGVVHRVLTKADAVIPDGQLGLEVPVRAEEAGTAANLGPGYYSVLPEPVPGIASVTNRDAWLTSPGADEEDDESLRLRARNQFQAVGQYHHDAGYRAVVTAFAGIRTDDILFFPMPAVPVELEATVDPLLSCGEERREALRTAAEDMIRAAFRENQDIEITRTFPQSRFSFSRLDRELHDALPDLRSVEFSLPDIVSELSLPVLRTLTVRLGEGV